MAETVSLTIGALARQARVSLDTVRYYERRGLLPAPPRTTSGYRQYPPDTVRRVAFIKRAQALGFTLDEIADLLALRATPQTDCQAVLRKTRTAITRLDAQLAEVDRMRRALLHLASVCQEGQTADACPVLAAIEAEARDAVPGHSPR